MHVRQPRDWPEALRTRAERPGATPVAGGTDVMVAMKMAHFRPELLLDLSRVPRDTRPVVDGGRVHLDAGTTYTGLVEQHAAQVPGLARAAAGVGSRQVRNRGTVGGSLGTASPTGDLHAMLLAAGAEVELRSVRHSRWLPAERFYLAPGRTALAADELITRIRIPLPRGPQVVRTAGRRRGMVKTLCSVAVTLDVEGRRARVGLATAGAAPCRAREAEDFLAAEWDAASLAEGPPPPAVSERFGRLVAGAATPATDVLASAAYRRHVAGVLARRGLAAAMGSHGEGSP